MSEVKFEPRKIDEEFNDLGLETEFEDEHFYARKDIDEDYNLIHEQKNTKHNYWLSDYALRRVYMNQNYILLLVGQVGSGKSYSGMALAEDIDPYFNVNRIVFHPSEFIELLDQGLPKGSVIMWEEVGVSLSSRDWYKEQNKIISSLFETFRRHNLILIMTVPFVKFIDSRIRSMIHGFAEMIDPTFTGGKFGWLKYFHVVVDQRSGKIRHRYPRIRDDEGKIQVIQGSSYDQGNMRFNLPSKDLLPPYEQKKLEFVEWQQKSGLEKFMDKEKIPQIEIKDFIQLLTQNPRKFKLIQKGDKKETLTNLIEHNWVLFKLDYPDHKFQKKDLVSALRFVLSSYDYKFKGANKNIQDNEIGTVIKLMNLVGDTPNTINQVSKMLNTSNHTLNNKVKEWKHNGMWDEWLIEVNGEPEDDDNESDQETDGVDVDEQTD